jgi:hypothetical protein
MPVVNVCDISNLQFPTDNFAQATGGARYTPSPSQNKEKI